MDVLAFISGCVVGGAVVAIAIAAAWAICAINAPNKEEQPNAGKT